MLCSGCDVDKPEEAFSFRIKAKGTRLKRCKSCQSEYRKKHYQAHRGDLIRRQKAINLRTLERNRRFIFDYLLTHPCVGEGCDESDPVVLEFDHKAGTKKKAAVARLIQDFASLAVIKAEIAKCQVLCANCHRRKTAREGGHYRHRMAAIGV